MYTQNSTIDIYTVLDLGVYIHHRTINIIFFACVCDKIFIA